MVTTSESLLMRLKLADGMDGTRGSETRSQAWTRFVELYTPLVFFWARKTGLQAQDAADLVQDVLTIVLQKLPRFEYDSSGSFRGWLRTVTLNCYRQLLRRRSIRIVETSDSFLGKLADHNVAESTWDLDYAGQLVARATELMKDDFAPATWKALKIWLSTGRPVGEIAAETGVSTWTIYSARARLLRRLRRELDGLLD